MHVRFRAQVQREVERLYQTMVDMVKEGVVDTAFETPGEVLCAYS